MTTNSEGGPGNDPRGNRFRVTKALIDTIYKTCPNALVGVALFAEGLVLMKDWDPNLVLFPGVTNPTGGNDQSYGYAWYALPRLILGADLNVAYQTNFGESLKGVGIDLGIAYHLYEHPVIGEHIVGVAVQNLINPTMGTFGTWQTRG